MKGRRWFEVRSAALLIGPLILDVFIKPFELEPITDPLNQFDEDLTFIPKITLSPKTRTSKDLGVALTSAQLHKKAGTIQ